MNCECNFSWATPEQNKEIEDYVDSMFVQYAKMIDNWIAEELLPSLMTVEDKLVFGGKTIYNKHKNKFNVKK